MKKIIIGLFIKKYLIWPTHRSFDNLHNFLIILYLSINFDQVNFNFLID